jgi:hypothetical protein
MFIILQNRLQLLEVFLVYWEFRFVKIFYEIL